METTQACTKCGIPKLLDEFHANVRTRNGRHTICKVCRNADERGTKRKRNRKEYQERWQTKRPDYLRSTTPVTGVCECCEKVKKLVQDHDHVTKKLRGRICYSCNSGIGLLGDSLESVQLAVAYLSKYFDPTVTTQGDTHGKLQELS